MLQVEGWNPVGACPGWKRGCGRKRHEHYFCSRCRIFRVHLSWIRNLCLFLFIWTSVQFWTSEPICFFYVRSVSAVLLFPLCAALRRYASRAWPRHCCLQLYLGAEPEGLDPYCYCMFYYYYYYYYYYYSSSLPMGVYGSPMNGTWENDEIWHTLRYGHK